MPDDISPTVENVRVVVRVRPMDQRERLDGAASCVSVDAVHGTIAVTRSNTTSPEPPRIYAYDAVFDSDTSQPVLIVGCIYIDVTFLVHLVSGSPAQSKTLPSALCIGNDTYYKRRDKMADRMFKYGFIY